MGRAVGQQTSINAYHWKNWLGCRTRSIRECKMRIERIGGSRLDTDSEVWVLDQTTWELMWAGEVAMQKSIPALRQAGYKSISDLPRIQKSYREKALVVIPPVIRICATWKGEQRVQVLIPVVQCTVRDANKLLDVIHKFEFWSGLRISISTKIYFCCHFRGSSIKYCFTSCRCFCDSPCTTEINT